jgi:hypothetical protein
VAQFDKVKVAFWDDSTYGVQPPLTDDAVREAEHVLGVELPAALLALLRIQNGGGVRNERRRFPTAKPTSWADDHVPFEHMLGIGHVEPALSLLDTPYLVQEWGLPMPIVLLSGDGHWWIALDYRASGSRGEPTVTWFDTDDGAELVLAANFQRFVEGLMP